VSYSKWLHCTVVSIWHPILSFCLAILRHCLKHVNRCEESAVVTVDSDIVDCYEKCHTPLQMLRMLICCMFMASVMIVPQLLLKNTAESFLCTELCITELQSSTSMKCGIGDASTSLERWVLNLRCYWLLWRPDQESNLGTGAIGTTCH
jgi:hypothetical protein